MYCTNASVLKDIYKKFDFPSYTMKIIQSNHLQTGIDSKQAWGPWDLAFGTVLVPGPSRCCMEGCGSEDLWQCKDITKSQQNLGKTSKECLRIEHGAFFFNEILGKIRCFRTLPLPFHALQVVELRIIFTHNNNRDKFRQGLGPNQFRLWRCSCRVLRTFDRRLWTINFYFICVLHSIQEEGLLKLEDYCFSLVSFFLMMYLVTFSLPPRTRTLKMLGAAQIFLHFSPASVNGDSGDLGPIKSRLCRFTSNRLIKPWTWDTGLLLMLRGLNSVKLTWARFDSSWGQIWGWDTVAGFDSGICLAGSLLGWLTISQQNWRLLSM